MDRYIQLGEYYIKDLKIFVNKLTFFGKTAAAR
jgi:hypothetical protein